MDNLLLYEIHKLSTYKTDNFRVCKNQENHTFEYVGRMAYKLTFSRSACFKVLTISVVKLEQPQPSQVSAL